MLPDSAIAGTNADDAIAVVEDLGGGKSGEDINAFRFDEPGKPLDEPTERDDVVAVILERRRRDRELDLSAARQEVDVVVVHFGRERRALLLEVRDELSKG